MENMNSNALPANADSPIQKPPLWKRMLKFLLIRVVFWYVMICLLAMFFQRKLLYHPSTMKTMPLSESSLQEGFVHEIAFQTADGLTLNGWHLLRTGQKTDTKEETQQALESAPLLVLFFHGNGGDRRGRVTYSLLMNRAEADVFLIDYRGYAENPGSPTEEGLAEDARGLWKYATETRNVKPERIVLFGESLGGGVAVRLAAELCEQGTPPAGLIVRSSFSSVTDTACHRFPFLPVRLLLWDRFPSAERIPKVTCPILVFHGTKDRIVPYYLGQKLFEAAPKESANHTPKKFVSLEDGTHNGVLQTHRKEYSQAVEQFLRSLVTNKQEN